MIITGLVRDEARFREFISRYEQLPAQDKIPLYYSTWTIEAAANKQLLTRFIEAGGLLVEQPEVDIKLTGHALHQMVALDAALSLLDPNTFVLKARPDFLDIDSYARFISIDPEPPKDPLFAYPYQQTRFYVQSYFPAHPFYIGDIIFAGSATDLRHLTCYPISALYKYHRVAPEQIIWSGSLLPFVTAMDWYFRSNIGLIFSDRERTERHRSSLIASDLYANVLALYFLLLESAFASLSNHFFTEDERLKELTLEDLLWSPTTSLPEVAHNPDCSTNSLLQFGIAQLLRERTLRKSPLSEKVFEAMQSHPDGLMQACAPAEHMAGALALAADNDAMNIYGSRALRPTTSGREIPKSCTSWTPMGDRSERVSQLEHEINIMRRTIDSLNKRLSTSIN